MSEEIYVVVAEDVPHCLDSRVKYVGTDADEALRVCEENMDYSGERKHDAFVQVWEEEEHQYTTRTNIRSS